VDLVVLAEVRWGYFRTRKQFLLSRFPESWRIFYAQPPAAGAADPWRPRREGRVTAFTVPFLKPATTSALYNNLTGLAPGRALIEAGAEGYLRLALRRLGVAPRPVVMASNIYCPGALSRLPRKLLFYDFNDHPLQFAGVPAWSERYFHRTIGQADAVFVVSEHYRRMLAAEFAMPLIQLGNGVEVDHFSAGHPVPPELAALPRPLIGYVGLLSHFLDFEVLEALRQARRGGTLVIVGPGTPATAAGLKALAARGGVALLGPRPYEEIPAWMQALDVGVIPFQANHPYVRGINPNKVYQYLAAGLPVVTTPVLDLEERSPHLQFATTPEGFRTAVGRALDAGPDPQARRALARPYDWTALAARMVGEIERRL
jgi:teichuronic acid biosynthesis glycosyltransferase TuaH